MERYSVHVYALSYFWNIFTDKKLSIDDWPDFVSWDVRRSRGCWSSTCRRKHTRWVHEKSYIEMFLEDMLDSSLKKVFVCEVAIALLKTLRYRIFESFLGQIEGCF